MNDMFTAFTQGKMNAIVAAFRGSRRWKMTAGDVQRPEAYVYQQKKNGWTWRVRFEGALLLLERCRVRADRSHTTPWELYRKAAIKDARVAEAGLLAPTWSVQL